MLKIKNIITALLFCNTILFYAGNFDINIPYNHQQDWPQISAIIRANFDTLSAHPEKHMEQHGSIDNTIEQGFKPMFEMENPFWHTDVTRHNGRAVGFINYKIACDAFKTTTNPFTWVGFIELLCVDKPFTRQKIGQQLLDNAMTTLKCDIKKFEAQEEVAIPKIMLVANMSNTPALKLYASRGLTLEKRLAYDCAVYSHRLS